MARDHEMIEIDDGPGKHEIELSLFDTAMGVRIVQFRNAETRLRYHVAITSVVRRHPAGILWDIGGLALTPAEKKRVSLTYRSDERTGMMRFEKEVGVQGILETPNDSKRVRALMIVIFKMVAEYQNYNVGHLSEKFFKLFEKAKRVDFAKDSRALAEAIEDIARE